MQQPHMDIVHYTQDLPLGLNVGTHSSDVVLSSPVPVTILGIPQ